MPIFISHTTSKEMWYQNKAGLEGCGPLGTIFGPEEKLTCKFREILLVPLQLQLLDDELLLFQDGI